MRIAVTADPYIPVPPIYYGGIERSVEMVVRGLAERGHEIILFAHPESSTSARVIGYGKPPHFGPTARATELCQVGWGLWSLRLQCDAVLSWGRLAALLPVIPMRKLPKVQRYCRTNQVPWRSVRIASRVGGRSICFSGPSRFAGLLPGGIFGPGEWHPIFDGVHTTRYTPINAVSSDAPLVFLGRLEPMKGAHIAIAVAKRSQRRLVIAGNRRDPAQDEGYFDREIAPQLDGDQICYVGPVNDQQKNGLLGSAAALLFTTCYEEAFGIVMAESMACGTPVIAPPRGSVPEVVRPGVNGWIAGTIEEMAAAVAKIRRIDRAAVRADCEQRFSAPVIVDQYERLLNEMVLKCR